MLARLKNLDGESLLGALGNPANAAQVLDNATENLRSMYTSLNKVIKAIIRGDRPIILPMMDEGVEREDCTRDDLFQALEKFQTDVESVAGKLASRAELLSNRLKEITESATSEILMASSAEDFAGAATASSDPQAAASTFLVRNSSEEIIMAALRNATRLNVKLKSVSRNDPWLLPSSFHINLSSDIHVACFPLISFSSSILHFVPCSPSFRCSLHRGG